MITTDFPVEGAPVEISAGEHALRRLDPAAAPFRVVEIELSEPAAVRPVTAGAPYAFSRPPIQGSVLALVRLHGAPLGTVTAEIADPAHATDVLMAKASQELAAAIAAHHARDETPLPRVPGRSLLRVAESSPACLWRRADALALQPMISVVVASRERPAQLARCLDSLVRQCYPRFEVIVVDNDPVTDDTQRLVRHRYFGEVSYTREYRRGLANAHNRGLAVARGQIVAFTDDDVIVDESWLAAIAEGFYVSEDVCCVTGLILPAELDTPAQIMLEAQGGFAKGFAPAYHSLRQPGDDRLFPFTAGRLGSGANMAFTSEALRRLGGFDPALGTGTAARGGDDLLAFFRAAASGHGIVYQPSAIVWHHHYREFAEAEKQAYGYGVGLGAYLTAAIAREPRMLPKLLRLLGPGISYAIAQLRSGNRDEQTQSSVWSRRTAAARRRGLIRGPFAYARSRWQSRGRERGR
ncbi:MAG TPA: glycosyltransferase family 2 protein [Actinocrinis sp.]|nr:glycosyltransferase family 2 protein [Actinocrinis sp.]